MSVAAIKNIKSSFGVTMLSAGIPAGCDGLSSSKLDELISSGFVKGTCPFGVLLVGSNKYPDVNLQYSANIIANLLDQNSDGKVDNPKLANTMKATSGYVMAGGATKEAEKPCDNLSFKYCYSLQTWKIGAWDEENSDEETETGDERMKRIVNEECFHFYSAIALSTTFPAAFGDTTFDSIICKEMSRLECVKPGWWHEENTCPAPSPRKPGNPASVPLKGTCTEPNCDCTEFFQQAALLMIGQKPGWMSPYMPTTQAGVKAMLSSSFKALFSNPTYNLPTKPFNTDYIALGLKENSTVDLSAKWMQISISTVGLTVISMI